MFKIALVSYEYPPDTGFGGVGTYVKQVAALLKGANCDVHIFAGTFGISSIMVTHNVTIHKVHCNCPQTFKKNVVNVFAIENNIQAFNVIESPEIHGNASEIVKAYPQIPLVVRLHAPNYLVEHLKQYHTPFSAKCRFVFGAFRQGRLDAGYWRKYNFKVDEDYIFAKQATVIVAPSTTMKNWAMQHWHFNINQITVLLNPYLPSNNFLNIDIVSADQSKKQILFFGRLNVLKGLVNATFAIKNLLKLYPDYSFCVVGDDGASHLHNLTMRQWMKQQLKNVLHKVTFINAIDNEALANIIADAEIVLLPSLFESFSYTCAEAMASGKAVVGAAKTGMADMIINGQNGLLVNTKSGNAIYKALQILIKNKQLRQKMGEAARETIITKFEADTLQNSYFNFYKKIASKQ